MAKKYFDFEIFRKIHEIIWELYFHVGNVPNSKRLDEHFFKLGKYVTNFVGNILIVNRFMHSRSQT